MASKTLLFAAVFVAALAAPVAQAQLLGLGKLNISGTVHCSVNASSATTASVFPNASVQLQCGSDVVASTTTDSNGAFDLSLNFVTSLLSTILGGCTLVVTTPLSTCDASLPSVGILQSALQLLGGVVGLVDGLLGSITSLIPTGFSLIQ
ncbi:phylloplanin [Iris pallida]|uniref:Phylloplanin n=1 Tax=Iris pallida TaxID=29817 RepID=A0AAX6FVZ4_IRIPA|nr:phylloplanin [Iris pallida]KAJ6820206.1 phylloplanin [Iris pallida]KAJ6820207.1 phylloplanin [Iris pallida]KAJ6820208.1 phylloplanin [Iris pallida]KAJ6831483.1 phylloplanin [Iris pallida]